MADKPALRIKAKRKDKTGDYIDIGAAWRSKVGSGYNLKPAPGVQILVNGEDVTNDFWLNIFENQDTKAEVHGLVKKITDTFEFPG